MGAEAAKDAAEGVAWLRGLAERLEDGPRLSKLSVNDKSTDSLRSLDVEAVPTLHASARCVSMPHASKCGHTRASVSVASRARVCMHVRIFVCTPVTTPRGLVSWTSVSFARCASRPLSRCLSACNAAILVFLSVATVHVGMSAVSGMRMHASMHMDGCDMIEDMVTLLTCILDLGKRRLL